LAKTWHDRIYDMLNLSLQDGPTDLATFKERIPELKVVPSSFVYRRCNEKGVYEDVCYQTTVETTADLCIALGLMNKRTGQLTALGERATSQAAFDGIVRKQLWQLLQAEFGLSRRKLGAIIGAILRGHITELPTGERIWSELGEPGDLLRFKRLLRLLGRSGGVEVSQRPTYLPLARR